MPGYAVHYDTLDGICANWRIGIVLWHKTPERLPDLVEFCGFELDYLENNEGDPMKYVALIRIIDYSLTTMSSPDNTVRSKRDRQAVIAEAVRTGRVTTQGELLACLRTYRIAVNQSTLSRDLAELGIRKADGQYVIAEPGDAGAPQLSLASAVRRFTTCGPHLIVMTTGQGQAQSVAVAIDVAREPSIIGTLAGDDTLFITTKNRRTQAVALRRICQWFGDKYER